MRRPWRSAVAISVIAVGCGVGPDVTVEPGQPPLPTLPPRTVSVESGGAGTNGATESQALRDARAGAAVDDWRQLAGFEGTLWTEDFRSQLTVLRDSLHVDDGVVYGLVRNEHPVPMGPITLRGDGIQTEPLIPTLRPGEPGPFILNLEEVGGDIPDLRATADDAASLPARNVRITVYWTRGIDDPRPADTYLHEDPTEGPHPFVAFGTVEAVDDVSGLRVVGAWLGRQGEVLRVAEGTVAKAHLEKGETTDFVISVHGPVALDDARLMLWATGS